jgi:hypothetical protein
MKKLFTLALALLVVVGGYSQVRKTSKSDAMKTSAQEITVAGDEVYQNVGSLPNMTRSDAELDFTYYDWQTNTAAKNLTMTFPDGCVGVAYVIATQPDYADRGTNIAIFYPDEDAWRTSEGLIEDHKTGFGCAARYGENGIVVVSRNPQSLTCEVYIIEDKDNLPHGDLAPVYVMPTEHNPHFPAVMCTGPDHKHIHILVTALNEVTDDGQTNPFYYIRSLDGGETWSDFMTIEYLGRDYCPQYGSGQDAYFMENTGGNRLDIVVNTRRGDGAVLTSLDEGDTWTKTKFYHHPGIDVDFGEGLAYMYPRWTSAFWDNEGTLHVAYEFGGGTGDATSTSYYPGIGGIAYWNSVMPYHGETLPQFGCDPTNPMPMVTGQPFIMDSAYINQDIYSSLWIWGDATHPMWNEYIGYVTPLDDDDQPLLDPYSATSFTISDDWTAHGSYNGGICEMPVLVTTPAQDLLVAVWVGMDDHHTGGVNNDHYFKVFCRASFDKGMTWTPMMNLTSDFMFVFSECVYPQAAITGNTLVFACQMDGEPDTYVIGSGGDVTPDDNYYQALTFDLMDLFGYDGIEEGQTVSNTHMSLYPNPAVDQLNITLNRNADIVIYNIMGQEVMSVEGHVGANTLNISSLSAGVYFVNAGSDTQKFIVK